MGANESALISVRWREVETEMVKGEVVSPEGLSKMAEDTPKLPRFVVTSDYADTIMILRDTKGMFWNEIGEWFSVRGLPFSIGSIQGVYFKERRRREQPYAPEPIHG